MEPGFASLNSGFREHGLRFLSRLALDLSIPLVLPQLFLNLLNSSFQGSHYTLLDISFLKPIFNKHAERQTLAYMRMQTYESTCTNIEAQVSCAPHPS